MRISSTQIAENSIYGITQSYSRYAVAQNEVSTGKQINQPSDDPNGLAQSLGFRQQYDQINEYQHTITQAKSFLSATDTALSSVNDLLRQARTIAVQGGSNVIPADTRSALVAQIQNIITQVGNVANSTDGTRYIFAGQRTEKAPFTATTTGNYVYSGGSYTTGDGAVKLDVGRGDTVQVNVTGDAVITPILNNLKTLRDDLSLGQSQTVSNTDLANLDTQINNVLSVRADVGANIQRLTQKSSDYDVTKDNLTKLISGIEDADYAKTIIEYQTAQTAYQAAAQSTAKIFQISLLDFIK